MLRNAPITDEADPTLFVATLGNRDFPIFFFFFFTAIAIFSCYLYTRVAIPRQWQGKTSSRGTSPATNSLFRPDSDTRCSIEVLIGCDCEWGPFSTNLLNWPSAPLPGLLLRLDARRWMMGLSVQALKR